ATRSTPASTASTTCRASCAPGTFNRKPKYGEPRPVTVLAHHPERRYRLEEIEAYLPAPPRPRPISARRVFDTPDHEQIRELLRHIDPMPGYGGWVRTLAAIHSVFPGADG